MKITSMLKTVVAVGLCLPLAGCMNPLEWIAKVFLSDSGPPPAVDVIGTQLADAGNDYDLKQLLVADINAPPGLDLTFELVDADTLIFLTDDGAWEVAVPFGNVAV